MNMNKVTLTQETKRTIIFSTFVTFFCSIALISNCGKPKPLLEVPPPSYFHWGEESKKTIKSLKKSGWLLSQESKREARLIVPIENELNQEAKELAKAGGIEAPNIPSIAEITLYSRTKKLMLARILRIDTQKRTHIYQKNIEKRYKLKKILWQAKAKKSKDETGNLFQETAKLYENSKSFILLRLSHLETVEKSLDKGYNNTLELWLYSKINPGLTKETLIREIEKEFPTTTNHNKP